MKKRICLWVDEKVLEDFKKYVLRKHKRLYKSLGDEINEALKYYLKHKKK
jgi:hypothetical protein